jgi:hypothetical protein
MTVAGPVLVTNRSALVPVTVVVVVALLLAGLGSEVMLVTVAVFVMMVPAGVAALTFAVNANVAVAPLAKVAKVAITVPVPPTGGVVNVAAGPEVCTKLTNVVPAGSTSGNDALLAASGPALLTVRV